MSTITPDIHCRLSGGASNNDPAKSLGGVMSSQAATPALFDGVTGTEATNGRTEHRLVYLYNDRATTFKGARVWIEKNTTSTMTDIEIGRGATGMNGLEPAIATDGATPPGVTFLNAQSIIEALIIGDLPSKQRLPLWIRWKVEAGTPVTASDPVTIRIDGGYEE